MHACWSAGAGNVSVFHCVTIPRWDKISSEKWQRWLFLFVSVGFDEKWPLKTPAHILTIRLLEMLLSLPLIVCWNSHRWDYYKCEEDKNVTDCGRCSIDGTLYKWLLLLTLIYAAYFVVFFVEVILTRVWNWFWRSLLDSSVRPPQGLTTVANVKPSRYYS